LHPSLVTHTAFLIVAHPDTRLNTTPPPPPPQSLVRIPETLLVAYEFISMYTPNDHQQPMDELRKMVRGVGGGLGFHRVDTMQRSDQLWLPPQPHAPPNTLNPNQPLRLWPSLPLKPQPLKPQPLKPQ